MNRSIKIWRDQNDLYHFPDTTHFSIAMTIQYNAYQFHDNLIHGISFLVENYRSDLHIDIDHILQWPICASDNPGPALFDVSRGNITFAHLTDLRIDIDWRNSNYTTAVAGISIDRSARLDSC